MRSALRRLGILFAGVAGGTAVLALPIGLALGAGVSRSVSVGWYGVGAAVLIGAFFIGNRGPSRSRGDGWTPFSFKRWVRWATPAEQNESISLSAILVVLGFLLIVLGVLADTRYKLT